MSWAVSSGGSQPISRVLSRTVIHLGHPSPHVSCDLPGPDAGDVWGSLFGLAPGGVCPAIAVTSNAVRSYRTISPLPRPNGRGGIFSVALSVGSRRPGIIWHLALWSPDFPPRPTGPERLSGQLPRAHYNSQGALLVELTHPFPPRWRRPASDQSTGAHCAEPQSSGISPSFPQFHGPVA